MDSKSESQHYQLLSEMCLNLEIQATNNEIPLLQLHV